MNSAVWVKWTETWTTPLIRLAPIAGLDLDGAEKALAQAEMARKLFNVVPMGNA